MPRPAVKYVDANGLRLAYLEEGTGVPVLLLHGFPDTAHTWDDVRPALAAAGYRAISPFMRGYWPTEVPTDGNVSGDVTGQDAVALMDALGLESALVVGHDWGASAAYSAAGLAPERIPFLVTVAIPHPGSLRPTPRLLWGARHFAALRTRRAVAKVQADDFAYLDMLVRRWSPAWDVPAGELDPVKESFRQPGSLDAALGYYRGQGLRPPPAQRKRIRMPSAVFSGEDDGVLVLADYERARSWYTAGYEIVHMPGGHFLHREHPERFIRELLRVLPSP